MIHRAGAKLILIAIAIVSLMASACGPQPSHSARTSRHTTRPSHPRHEHAHLHPHPIGAHHHHPHPHPHLAGPDGHHHPY